MSRFRDRAPTVLMPQPEKPFWHRSITLAPPLTCTGRVLAHRAPVRKELGSEQLRAPPPPPALLDSDGVPVDIRGRKATLAFAVSCRTSVVSTDWVHTAHPSTVRTWRVRFPVAYCASGDIFVGCTEATSFENHGRTVVFDCRGAMRAGYHPLNLFHRFAADEVAALEGATVNGEFRGVAAESEVEVTVDVTNPETSSLRLQFSNGDLIVYPLGTVAHARLCVSLRCVGDVVELC